MVLRRIRKKIQRASHIFEVLDSRQWKKSGKVAEFVLVSLTPTPSKCGWTFFKGEKVAESRVTQSRLALQFRNIRNLASFISIYRHPFCIDFRCIRKILYHCILKKICELIFGGKFAQLFPNTESIIR